MPPPSTTSPIFFRDFVYSISLSRVPLFSRRVQPLQPLAIPLYNMFQGDLPHLSLGGGLYLLVAVGQGQLDIDPHAAGGVGVGILMENGLFSLHRPVGIQQGDLTGASGKPRARMSPYAGQQSGFPQRGHELTHIGRVCLNTLRDFLAGQLCPGMQGKEGQDMDGVAEFGGIFDGKIPLSLMLFLL